MSDQPEHSILGASSAKRWINCPGSINLIASPAATAEGWEVDDGEDYSGLGTVAHFVGSDCLESNIDAWELIGRKFDVEGTSFVVDGEMADHVQTYLDFVNSLLAEAEVPNSPLFGIEDQFRLSSLHPLFYGTADFWIVIGNLLHVIDFKYGQGVTVEPEENEQGMYYAVGVLDRLMTIRPDIDIHKVTITIVQPRDFNPRGAVRSWDTTPGALGEWAYTILVPAAKRTEDPEASLRPGDWCQFCPARANCPALASLSDDYEMIVAPAETFTDDEIGFYLSRAPALRHFLKALGREGKMRAMRGHMIPGQKLVEGKTNRAWKGEAREELLRVLGDDALTSRELKSPAVIQKMPGGKSLVTRLAYKPQGDLTLVEASNSKTEVKRSAQEVFAAIKT